MNGWMDKGYGVFTWDGIYLDMEKKTFGASLVYLEGIMLNEITETER